MKKITGLEKYGNRTFKIIIYLGYKFQRNNSRTTHIQEKTKNAITVMR